MTQHPDEGTLHAYIDDELPRAEAEALEAHVAGCASCSAELAEARGLVAATSQVITALDAAPAAGRPAAAGVERTAAAPTPRASRPLIFRMPYARAAALLLVIGGSAFVADRSGMFDGSARSRSVSTAADAVQRSEPVAEAAPEGPTSAAAATVSPPSAPTDLSSAAVGSASGAAVRTVPVMPRAAANRSTRDGAQAMSDQRATVAPDTRPASRLLDAPAATALKRVESVEGTRAAGLAAAPAPLMAPPPPARAVDAQLSAALEIGSVTPGTLVSRYRTKNGTVVTLTEETLRTSFAEESDPRRTAAAGVQRPTAAPMAAPVMNSYRWSTPEQGRSYTLTGPLPVAELEALSKRLSELERLP